MSFSGEVSSAFRATTTHAVNEADDRDPRRINSYLMVQFEDIYAEPKGIESMKSVWLCSQKAFSCSFNCCYLLLTLLTAPIAAFLHGLSFACLACNHIWCVGPQLAACRMNLVAVRKMLRLVLGACCGPCCEVAGLLCSKIKVRYQRLPEGQDEDVDEDILQVVTQDIKTGHFKSAHLEAK